MTGAPEGEPGAVLVVRAGDHGTRLLASRLRTRGWILLVVVVPGVLGLLSRDRLDQVGGASVLGLVVVLLAGVALSRWRYRRAVLSLTAAEVVLQVGRRRTVVARPEVARVVVGWLESFPERGTGEVVLAGRDDRALLTLPRARWSDADLDRFTEALGVPVQPFDPERHRSLQSFGARRPWLVGGALAVVLVVAVIAAAAVAVVVQARGDADDRARVRAAYDDWAAEVGAQATVDLADVEVDEEEDDAVGVALRVQATTDQPEADPELLAAVLDRACTTATDLSFSLDTAVDTRLEVTTLLAARPVGTDGGYAERQVRLACDDGTLTADPALAWLRHLRSVPFDDDVRAVHLEASSAFADAPLEAAVFVSATGAAPTTDAVTDAVVTGCAGGPGADRAAAEALVLRIYDADDLDGEERGADCSTVS